MKKSRAYFSLTLTVVVGMRHRIVLLGLILPLIVVAAEKQAPWFGLNLPPPVDLTAPLAESVRQSESAKFADGETKFPAFAGNRILQDVTTIVGFSQQSRQHKEIGSGQLWGRISGFPSSSKTINWAADQFRQAGIDRVDIQTFTQSPDSQLWLPLSWQVTLHGNPAFGHGSRDVILESAMPLAPSSSTEPVNNAQLVYVGTGSTAETQHLNLLGKVVVQRVTPQAHMVFERGTVAPQAQQFFARGALAVLNIVDLPGNMLARDFSNCGGLCFNLGGRDGRFLRQVLEQAAAKDLLDKVAISLQLEGKRFSGLNAHNAIAVVPGKKGVRTAEETLVINAHADAWFDGAGDNGDGLAVMVALARHFAKRPLNRALVFVASAGHHTAGLNGPRNVVAQNADLMKKVQVIINIEHVAQRNIVPARLLYPDGYRQYTADSREAPIVAGISNSAPYLENLIAAGVQRFGVNFVGAPSDMASGEGGGYRQLDRAIITTMQAPPFYHTSGESIDMISAPGLERMAHFMADLIEQLAVADTKLINP